MAEEDKIDPLDEIFVDANEPADKKLLVEILKDFVTIDQKGIILFLDPCNRLTESEKALVYLLCKKAMILKGVEGKEERSSVKEVSSGANISESSAKNALFTYYKNIVKKGIIPNYNLRKVKEILIKNE